MLTLLISLTATAGNTKDVRIKPVASPVAKIFLDRLYMINLLVIYIKQYLVVFINESLNDYDICYKFVT